MNHAPSTVLAPGDPGDDTQHRFRYQAVRACCYILALFDEDEGVVEVFCEHHEDILVRYRTGRFRGVQIKTRSDGAVPFKTSDEEIIASLRRFVTTEERFPGQFDGYVLAASCGFWAEVKNGSNLRHLIDLARGKDLSEIPSPVAAFLAKLCPKSTVARGDGKKGAAPPTAPPEPHEARLGRALRVLHLLSLDHTPPLADADQSLLHALAKCPAVGAAHRYSDLRSIAAAMVGEVLRASSRQDDSAKHHYLALCQDPVGAAVGALIALKRFDRSRAEAVIAGVLRGCVAGRPPSFSVARLPHGTRVQAAKLTAGGVVIDDVDEAVQQRHAAEYALAAWINKEGVPAADARYQDVRSAVLTECNAARAVVGAADGQYGPAMLHHVRDRLKALRETDGSPLHGLRYDQLLGMAGILTEECVLWWSERFALPDEGAA